MLLSNSTNIVSAILAVAGALSTLTSAEAAEHAPSVQGLPTKAVSAASAGVKPAEGAAAPPTFDETCFAETVCRLKEKLRWQKPAWDAEFCKQIAHDFVTAGNELDLHPALLLAIAINESDLDEKAVLPTVRGENVYAKDGGLMGIRCILDDKGRCTNGNVKGRMWTNIMTPQENIALGARELAHYRDGAAIERVERRIRGRDGRISQVTRTSRCKHRTHAYWAHYNHGPLYRSEGYARHYPHRVAVIYYALVKAMGLPIPAELTGRLTIVDRGLRPRTADRPVEQRFKDLVGLIENAPNSCSNFATLN